jgi:hypothetical protein
VKCARRAKILQERQLTNTRSVLAPRVSLNHLAQDADAVRLDCSREFNVLNHVEPTLAQFDFRDVALPRPQSSEP